MPVTSKDQAVSIRPLNIERVTVRIEGVSPLITDRFSVASIEAVAASQAGSGAKQVRVKKAARDPEAEFLDRLYVIDEANGVYGFPAGGVKKAMVNAGGRFTDAQMTWLRGVFNIDADLLSIEAPAPVMRADHVVQMGRGNVRYRPAFFPWAMELPISYNADEIGPTEIISLIQQAGFSIGIGNWRPEKNGSFGTFRVVAP